MAQLRFNRDRRGYETTALLHAGGRRRRGQRLLYFFRTPPGVRVGRAPIDEDAIRLLEQHNPDVQFDWTRLLRGESSAVGAESAARTDAGERGGNDERSVRSKGSERDRSKRAERPAREKAGRGESGGTPEDSRMPPAGPGLDAASSAHPDASSTPESASSEFDASHAPSVVSAAYDRLGSEALGRLRARYAEVMARIAEHDADDRAREELKGRAERLNPDGWVTADEVAAALEQYETVFEELRAIVGRHPRGRRAP